MFNVTFYAKFLIFLAIYLLSSCGESKADGFKLRNIHVIFRHGDRTPEALYPKDPHSLSEFYPTPLGGLINEGKLREYELGRFLRKTYYRFIGDLYIPSEVHARSTGYDRTQMSLLLVLAGLYPPKPPQRWNPDLNWQPIPIITAPKDDDPLLHPKACPTYTKEMNRVKETKEYKKDLAQFKELMAKMTEYTGEEMSGTDKIIDVFHTLTSERAMNMEIPKWANDYFPQGPMIDAVIFQYKTMNYNNLLKRLNGGTFLRKIFDDMKSTEKGESVPKVNLYSAHEITVAAALFALNVWKPVVPEYSSAVILELWEIDSIFHVKVEYYNGIPAEAENRIIPGCDKYCPLDKFEKLMSDILPNDYVQECYGVTINKKRKTTGKKKVISPKSSSFPQRKRIFPA